MLGTILRLFRPSYALTALILFGGWQGYSFVKSVPEKLSLPFGISSKAQIEEKAQAKPQMNTDGHGYQSAVDRAENSQKTSSRFVAAIQGVNPVMRFFYWVVIYALLCFATVPVIKKMLARESNFINAILIIIYSGIGFLLAVGLAAFQFTWITAIMLLAALVFSVCIIIWLASELEKIRVQDSFM